MMTEQYVMIDDGRLTADFVPTPEYFVPTPE
jgi:hypothetical protein